VGVDKNYVKKILPWGILISSNFEPLGLEVWMVLCFANYFLFKSVWAPCAVLRVDSSTTDPPFWVGRIPLYHSTLGIRIIAWGSHSSMNHVLADS